MPVYAPRPTAAQIGAAIDASNQRIYIPGGFKTSFFSESAIDDLSKAAAELQHQIYLLAMANHIPVTHPKALAEEEYKPLSPYKPNNNWLA